MNEENYWERFMMTGSINDFLAYKNKLQEKQEGSITNSAAKEELGEHSHAGIYRDYGNGVKG